MNADGIIRTYPKSFGLYESRLCTSSRCPSGLLLSTPTTTNPKTRIKISLSNIFWTKKYFTKLSICSYKTLSTFVFEVKIKWYLTKQMHLLLFTTTWVCRQTPTTLTSRRSRDHRHWESTWMPSLTLSILTMASLTFSSSTITSLTLASYTYGKLSLTKYNFLFQLISFTSGI